MVHRAPLILNLFLLKLLGDSLAGVFAAAEKLLVLRLVQLESGIIENSLLHTHNQSTLTDDSPPQ